VVIEKVIFAKDSDDYSSIHTFLMAEPSLLALRYNLPSAFGASITNAA